MSLKSAEVRGVAGLSAASSNQASSSGVTSKTFVCCSRTERRTSFTNLLASAQAPARTCSCKKSSTSLANAIVTGLMCEKGINVSRHRVIQDSNSSSVDYLKTVKRESFCRFDPQNCVQSQDTVVSQQDTTGHFSDGRTLRNQARRAYSPLGPPKWKPVSSS